MMDIVLGITQRKTARRLLWKQSNGLIIAGGSGSGKSQTACWYATQYALKGAKLILGEYAAYSPEGEGLVDRCEHLKQSFYLPPARTAQEVIKYIDFFKELAERRLDPVTGKTTNNFPIVFFIDEFSALMLDYTKDVPVDKLRSMAITIRKAQMKMVIMGQSWSQLTNEVPQLRNAFDHTILHRISPNNVKVFDTSTDVQRTVARLQPGYALKDGDLMYVPSKMTSDDLEYARKKIAEMHTNDALLDELLSSPQYTDRQTEHTESLENTDTSDRLSDVKIEDKRDLIALLHKIGKSYSEIRELIRGDNNTLRTLYNNVVDNND